MNRNGILAVVDDKGREKERYQVVYGAKILVEDGAPVKANQILLEWDPYTFSILTEVSGVGSLQGPASKASPCRSRWTKSPAMSQLVVVDSPDEKRMPTIDHPSGRAAAKHDEKRYLMPTHAHLMVRDGEEVHAGDVLAKIPRATTKTKDITGGLPRVVELFEARKPRETADHRGDQRRREVRRSHKGSRARSTSSATTASSANTRCRAASTSTFRKASVCKAGDPLMDGPRNPHDILHVLGEKELQKYLVNEIQEVYRLQGVNINDKHLEVIVRQMMRWVKVEDIGDTEFLPEEVVDKFKFREENRSCASKRAAARRTGKPMLLGITKASLSTDSFISAASFQETTRVLTEAAINGKVDYLRGLKENVIMGRLIPAGTGMEYYRQVKIAGEDVVEEELITDDIALVEGIPGYDEDARIQYAGGLSEGTPEELAE